MMMYSNITKSSSHCDGCCPLALLPSCLSPCPLAPVSAPTSTARAAQAGGRAAAPWLKEQGGLSGPAALGRPGQCRSRGRHLSRCLCRPQLRPPRPRCVSGAPGFTNHLPFQTGPTGPTRTRRDRVKGRARRRRRAHRRPQSRPEQRRERQERSKQRPWSVSRRRQSRGGPSAEEGQGLSRVASRFEGGSCEAERAGSGRALEPLHFDFR